MSEMLFLVIVIVGIVLLLSIFVGGSSAYPYVKAGPLLSPAEANFMVALVQATAGRYNVATKVRVADVINVKKGLNRKNAIIALNRIAAKHVDYVLTDPKTHQSLAAVELDDASHARADRRKRDEFLNNAFKAAGLPLIRIKPTRSYDRQAIASTIETAINPPAPGQLAGRAPSPRATAQ